MLTLTKQLIEIGPIKLGPVLYEARVYEPTKRSITVKSDYSYKTNSYFLQFPYMIFVRKAGIIPILKVAFATKPIVNKNSQILFPTLPNIRGGNFQVCFGYSRKRGNNIEAMVQEFWSQSFYHSLSYCGSAKLKRIFGTFAKWQKLDLKQINEMLLTDSDDIDSVDNLMKASW